MPPLKIVADENIPLVPQLFGQYGEIKLLAGREIGRAEAAHADVLLVRSVTRVDGRLLEGGAVRFVGSASVGTDHVDVEELARRGIAFAHAPGSNADSVVEYVLAALFTLSVRKLRPIRGCTVGIVGCGNIGGRLASRLPALGCKVLLNDPPLAEKAERDGLAHEFIDLDSLLAASDILTLHVPLVEGGPLSTRHLIDAARLQSLRRGAWLINASRGCVVDNAALLEEMDHLGAVVLDVWENEPEPDRRLVERVDLATPHIAGYSYDGKITGSMMIYQAFLSFLGVATTDAKITAEEERLLLAPPDPFLPEADWLHMAISRMYRISEDDRRMRDFEESGYFTRLRRDYPIRRTFSAYEIGGTLIPEPFVTAAERALEVRVRSRIYGR